MLACGNPRVYSTDSLNGENTSEEYKKDFSVALWVVARKSFSILGLQEKCIVL